MGFLAPHTDDVPEIKGIILIDCWEPPVWKNHFQTFYHDLVKRSCTWSLDCVVNACYGNQFDLSGIDADSSMINTMERYCWHDHAREHVELMYRIIRSCNGRNVTSHVLKKYLLNVCPSVFLTDVQDFVEHWQKALGAAPMKWLVAGQVWQVCTHSRPLGLQNLQLVTQQYPELEFYVQDTSILKLDGSTATWRDFNEDWLSWQEVRGWGARLLPDQK